MTKKEGQKYRMRWACLLIALPLLASCAGVSDYSPADGSSPSSYNGNQNGAGVQTSIWSNDPGQKTLTNQKGASSTSGSP